MTKVFPLWHVRKADKYEDDAKLIGIYSTSEAADQAVNRVKDQPGFREFPLGFQVDMYEMDKDHWVEGFVWTGTDHD